MTRITELENQIKRLEILLKVEKEKEEEKNRLKIAIPKPLEKIDWNNLIKYCEDYLQNLAKREQCKDIDHYTCEKVLETIYGDNVWDFINQFDE
jgi:hypothetical protein